MPRTTTLINSVQIIGTEETIAIGWLLTTGGKISAYGSGDPPQGLDLSDCDSISGNNLTLLPGFIDQHTHGAIGVNFVGADFDGLQQVSRFFASHGVTGFLVTAWAASNDEILHVLDIVKSVIDREEGAAILGVHLEGPYINPVRAGAQNPRHIRPADHGEIEKYLESGLVRLVTLAPEIAENSWLIPTLTKMGVPIAAGHTNATYVEMEAAARQGIKVITHCFNGMRAFNHREPGAAGAALVLPDLICEVIADRVHIHPAAVQLLYKLKGPDKVILITDSISGAGMPDGSFSLGEQKVSYSKGRALLPDGTLAGSLLTMDIALQNLLEITGAGLAACWKCASFNSARVLGISDHKGVIHVGCDADLVLMDTKLEIKLTLVKGRTVYRAEDFR